MGQTILCEVIAAWEETGEQPDFTQYGFASVLDALREAQYIMFELGASCNRLREKLDSQQSAQQRLAEGLAGIRPVDEVTRQIVEAELRLEPWRSTPPASKA